MAGAATSYFSEKLDQYQEIFKQGALAAPKVAAANQALGILEKETITQAEAEVLISLYQQAQ